NIKNISHFTGRNEKDLFYHANDGIGHYDGSDLKTIFKLDYNVGFSDAVIFEKDVYFVCPNLDKNIFIIVHGKLQ
ncbi:MAG: hypothetical protein Q8903_06605, partial [Bacteroidota bacterium]|nr:hypothetical protein [Bacteroidota bacterium]